MGSHQADVNPFLGEPVVRVVDGVLVHLVADDESMTVSRAERD
jgi:hypothetical protein